MDGGSAVRLRALRDTTRLFVDAVGEPEGGRLWERSQRTASSHRVHHAAIDVLRRLNRMRPAELVTWDAHVRRPGHFDVPTAELARAVRRALEFGDEHIAQVGAALGASLPDGHLRETSLARLTGAASWSYALLALRATDPVPQVRLEALKAIDRIPLHEVAEMLPFIALLATRRRGALLLYDVMSRVATPAGLNDLRIGLRHETGAVRLASWQALTAAGWEPTTADIRAHLGDRDVRIRAVALDRAGSLPPRERWEVASIAASDPVGAIRAKAISTLLALGLQPGPWLDAALGDHVREVRAVVQAGLRALGREPAQTYRRRLDQRTHEIDVLGLGECGGPSDAERLRSLLGDTHAAVRDAALRSLAKLEPVSVAAVAERALDDPAPKVVASAVAILRRSRVDAAVAERLERRVASDRRVAIRLSALTLLPRRTPWRRIGCVMTAMGDPSPLVRSDARRELDRWLRREVSPTGPPTGAEWAVIRRASAVLDDARRSRLVALATGGDDTTARPEPFVT